MLSWASMFTVINPLQRLKAYSPISLTFFGIVISDREMHNEKALSDIFSRLDEKLTVVSDFKAANARVPMHLTPLESVMDVMSMSEYLNILETYFTPFGIMTSESVPLYFSATPFPTITNSSVRESNHGVSAKAEASISSTEDGTVTLSREVHSKKAFSSIFFTLFGIVTDFMWLFFLKSPLPSEVTAVLPIISGIFMTVSSPVYSVSVASLFIILYE